MRLVAVTRALNEDDIVEAFIRHTAAFVDHHIILDNGSADRTVPILRALHQEGLPLTVMQNRSASFSEQRHNTYLTQIAAQAQQADWIVCLDCDEFIDLRVDPSLKTVLARQPENVDCIKIRLANYHATADDDSADPLVPRRMGRRDATQIDVWKVFVRAGPHLNGAIVADGNHELFLVGRVPVSPVVTTITLAHYPRRSAAQLLSKALTGRIKVLAAGRVAIEAELAKHYTPLFEMMRDEPHRLLDNVDFMQSLGGGLDLVDDPIPYRGGELRYTEPADPWRKAIRVMTGTVEALARQHGRLIDENMAVRNQTVLWAGEFERLF